MKEGKKLFAEFTWDNYRNDNDEPQRREIKNVDEAVQYGTQKSASLFRTYEIETVEVGGKTFTSDPVNFSGRNYINADRLYTPQEVIAEVNKAAASPDMDALIRQLERNGLSKQAQQLRQAAADTPPIVKQAQGDLNETRYVRMPYKGFIRLERGDEAYDRNGKKVWPDISTPVPANDGPKMPKPSDKFKLK